MGNKVSFKEFFLSKRPDWTNIDWYKPVFELCDEVVASGRNVIVIMPPRSGKTTIFSVMLPLYVKYLNGNLSAMIGAHSSDVAKVSKQMIECDHQYAICDDDNIDTFSVSNLKEGDVRDDMDIVIVDEPYMNYDELLNNEDAVCEAVSKLMQRKVSKPCPVVVCMTKLNEKFCLLNAMALHTGVDVYRFPRDCESARKILADAAYDIAYGCKYTGHSTAVNY